MKSGIQLAWTGVILLKPMLETAERIHPDNSGLRASHALEVGDCVADVLILASRERSGAILELFPARYSSWSDVP